MRSVVLAVVIGLGVGGAGACSGAHEPQRAPTRTAAAPPPAPELNVPSLLSLSIDELAKRVGPVRRLPADFVDPTLLPTNDQSLQEDSMHYFRYQHLAMVAFFSPHTRRVNNLLLLGTDEDALMSRAQLQVGANRYLVLPVFESLRPTQLMGVRVVATTFQ